MSELVSKAPRFRAPAAVADSAATIDQSCRLPVTLAAVGAAKWLVFGLVFLLLGSLQRQMPEFLTSIPWLTHGRVWAAGQNIVVYGFGFQMAFVALFWGLSRLNRIAFRYPGWAMVALVIWNLGVLAGVLGILSGGSTGFALLEMPQYAAPLLFVGFGIIAILSFLQFHFRSVRGTYPTQWYFIAALLWWPWSYSISQALLVIHPVHGVTQAAVHGWYLASLFGLFFVPIALGLIFYFVPKLMERPLHSRYLAAFAFWTLAFVAPWTGLIAYGQGPLPAWLITLSSAMGLLMVIPVAAAAWNYRMTTCGSKKVWSDNIVVGSAAFAMVSYLVASVLQLALSFRPISEVILLTQFSQAVPSLTLYGVFGLVAFGAAYHIVPRVWGCVWPHASFPKIHLLVHGLGIVLLFLATAVGGMVQGFALNDPTLSYSEVITKTQPFLKMETVAYAVLLLGSMLFFVNAVRLVHRSCWNIARNTVVWAEVVQAYKSEVKS